MPDRPSRREFLTGRAARAELESLGDATADALVDELADVRPVPSGGNAIHLATRAMSCEFAVVMNPGPSDRVATASDALDLVHALEAQMTVYRPDSELSRLNARAADDSVAVEPRLFHLLHEAQRISVETDGAFDPTSGPLVALWRDCRDAGRIPTQDEIDAARRNCGMGRVAFDAARRTVRFDRSGVELNLGAIGKGHALDRLAERIGEARASSQPANASLESFLIHGGHSSILARGDHHRTGGWPVGLRNPAFPSEHMATLLLTNVALSTSGAGEQFYRHEGRRYGHLLDPRSGWPAEGMLSVTVLAPTAAEADALSTAFFIGGIELARRYCRDHPQVSALFTPELTQGRTVEIQTLNLPNGVLFPAPSTRVERL